MPVFNIWIEPTTNEQDLTTGDKRFKDYKRCMLDRGYALRTYQFSSLNLRQKHQQREPELSVVS